MTEKKKEEKEKKEEESVAGGILKGIGKMIPGLGGLFKGLEKSPAFKERLKKIDEEVERKLKEEPLKRTEGGIPRVGAKFSMRPLAKGKPHVRKETSHPVPQERPVDIFDEKDYLKIIAEIPGVDENDINLNLQGDKLTISTDIPKRRYHQELKLPCVPKGKIEKVYKNGILEVKIQKTEGRKQK